LLSIRLDRVLDYLFAKLLFVISKFDKVLLLLFYSFFDDSTTKNESKAGSKYFSSPLKIISINFLLTKSDVKYLNAFSVKEGNLMTWKLTEIEIVKGKKYKLNINKVD